MLGGVVISELAWLISLENKRADFDRKSSAQIAISKGIIERLKGGLPVDVKKELLAAEQSEDVSLNAILESLEAGDNRWGEAKGGVKLASHNPIIDQTKNGLQSEPKSKGTWL